MLFKHFKTISIFVLVTLSIISCKDEDEFPGLPPANDFQAQYDVDLAKIEDYLKNNYMTVDANLNATFTLIPEGGTQVSIMNQTDFPVQSIIEVENDSRLTIRTDGRVTDPVKYTLYYIMLNEGGGQNPITIDSSYVSYKGWNFNNVEVDRAETPVWTSFPITNTFISGFRQILPLLKTAETITENPDGTVNYINAGKCIVFIPSGLAYFNSSRGPNLPSYSNLGFQIELKTLNRMDHDNDRIMSHLELYGTETNYFKQDSDGDFIPDFLDIDDDGDGFLTRNEFKIMGTVPQQYYDFTTIPDCANDVTNPNRVKRFLDPNCHQ
jgi:hypothetical protein